MTECGTHKRTRNTFLLDGVFWQDVVTFDGAISCPLKFYAHLNVAAGPQLDGARPPHTHAYLDMVQ